MTEGHDLTATADRPVASPAAIGISGNRTGREQISDAGGEVGTMGSADESEVSPKYNCGCRDGATSAIELTVGETMKSELPFLATRPSCGESQQR
jgi:hypothetical protein